MRKLNILFLGLLFSASSLFAQEKLADTSTAPIFTHTTAFGDTVSLSQYKGQKVFLVFTRSAGCPICNLYVHQLQEFADSFKQKDIVVLIVTQTKAENTRKYIENENFPYTFLSDPERKLYKLYGVESSAGKLIKGYLFKGGRAKSKKGKKLYKEAFKQEGDTDMIGADFLIDEDGKLIKAFYGKYLGDRMEVKEILSLFNK